MIRVRVDTLVSSVGSCVQAWEVTVDGMLALARREGEGDLLSAAASLVPMVKPEPPSPAVLKQAAYQLCSLDEAVAVDENE